MSAIRGIAVCLALVLASGALALDPASRMTQYGFDVWTSRDGMPQNSVRVVQQTSDGYLWLGTRAGLVRFDGVSFTTFDSSNTPELVIDHILAMAPGPGGSLWAGSINGILVRVERGQVRSWPAPQLRRQTIRVLLADRSGRLWIGTDAGLFRMETGDLVSVPTGRDPADRAIKSLHQDRAGTVWVGTDAGLKRVVASGVAEPISDPSQTASRVLAIEGDGSGGLWLGTRHGGLTHFRDGVFTDVPLAGWPKSVAILSLARDLDGNLWIGSDGNGLGRYSGGRFDLLTTNGGLTNQVVRALFEDREGSLWIGTAGGGLNRLRDGKVKVLSQREGMPADMVRSAFEDSEGNVWLGTGAGIVRVRGERLEVFDQRHGVPGHLVWPVFRDRDGAVWAAGSAEKRLVAFSGGRISKTNAKDVLTGFDVRVLFQDRSGDVWVGTSRGLFCFRDGQRVPVNGTNDVFLSGQIAAMLESRDGSLWVASSNGVYVRRHGVFAPVSMDGLHTRFAVALHEDADENLWIGTPAGLAVWRAGRIRLIDPRAGIPEIDIYSLSEDGRGGFWITGRRGMFRVNETSMRALASGSISRVTADSIATGDSLRGATELNWGLQPLVAAGRDGRVWVPSYGGVVITDPARSVRHPRPPPVYIERVALDGKPLESAAPAGHRLDFAFTALTYVAPESVRFRYMLEGFDRDWVDGGQRRSAFYTAVPPGQYKFRVRAGSRDGGWVSDEAAVNVELRPQFYQTWWFGTLLGITVIAILAAGHFARIQSLRKRELLLEAHVATRTAELSAEVIERRRAEQAAEAANQAKSEFLANMSHEIRTPMNGVIGVTELVLESDLTQQQREQMEIVKNSAESLLVLLNEVLDFSKLEAGRLELHPAPFSLREVVAASVQVIAAGCRQKGLDLAWIVRHDVPDAWNGDAPRLRQVLLNLLGNALKFTERGEIVVHVESDQAEPGRLLFSVSDTGIGIAAEQQARIFDLFTQADSSVSRTYGGSGLGLAISKKIVQLLGGDIRVDSRLGHGSTFHFSTRLDPLPATGPDWALAGSTVSIGSRHSATARGLTELTRFWRMQPVENGQPADYAIVDRCDAPGAPPQVLRRSVGLRWPATDADGRGAGRFDTCISKPAGPKELLRALTGADDEKWQRDSQPLPYRLRVLVAEDNAVNQKVTRSVLEQDGHSVTIVADGRQAIEAVDRDEFDLILMDLQMPVMDGVRAATQLRKSGNRTPIVALTACATSEDTMQCFAAGMDAYLSKPVRRAELRNVLLRVTEPRG